ncbi:MAG: phosphoglycolate phosphatase [Pusillimonas sp.]|nr:phosphoglycolate phosphatase [Pusillimonas sp.]
MTYYAALIDLDGTLVNTIPDLADATNAMRTQMGLHPLQQDIIARYVGKGTENLVKKALATQLNQQPDDATLQQGLYLFNQHYHRVNGEKSTLYDGVIEGLSLFRHHQIKMAVVTNKPSEFTLPLLRACGLHNYFEQVVCGDTCSQKKPHPMPLLHACNLLGVAPENALLIGDSAHDTEAADAAGIDVLAVPYGYDNGQNVQNLKVNDIVSSIEAAACWAARH